jgi:hypothetical protein
MPRNVMSWRMTRLGTVVEGRAVSLTEAVIILDIAMTRASPLAQGERTSKFDAIGSRNLPQYAELGCCLRCELMLLT